ncbi:MAG: hypothetical protein MJ211_13065 [Bacteroidales bacterium]|nr:hypothetical protein [Bacteroidales bacterium]
MKKFFSTLLAITTCFSVNAQSGITSNIDRLVFDDLTNNPLSGISQSYDTLTAIGDINKDGINDMIVIAYPTDKKNISKEEIPNMNDPNDPYILNCDNNQPTMAVYFGTENNQYKKVNEYNKSICPKGLENGDEIKIEITNKGLLRISKTIFSAPPNWSPFASGVYLFRYQNNDFFLIGKTYYQNWSADGWAETKITDSFNFLTGKRVTTEDGASTNSTCSKKLIALSNFVIYTNDEDF